MQMARIRAITIVAVLVIASVVLAIVTVNRDTQGELTEAERCPAGYVPVSTEIPNNEAEITINVFNATQTPGRGGSVASDFRNRGFNIEGVANETGNGEPDYVAIIRYGPETIGDAHLISAYFLNNQQLQFDIERDDDIVDVVIGRQFKQLATPTEMNQAIAAMGRPELPDGTCKKAGE